MDVGGGGGGGKLTIPKRTMHESWRNDGRNAAAVIKRNAFFEYR